MEYIYLLFIAGVVITAFFIIIMLWRFYHRQLSLMQKDIIILERDRAAYAQQVENLEQQIINNKQTQQDLVNLAKGASLQVAQELSGKLLEDHKRENNQARETTQQQMQHITNNVMQHVQNMQQYLQQLTVWKDEATPQIQQLTKIFSEPLKGGRAGETILENTLQSLGYRLGIDYITQQGGYDDEGQMKRPDACLILPSQTAIIIDSKSSQFFGASDDDNKKHLKDSMRKHVINLASKNYETLIHTVIKDNFPHHDTQHIFIFMFLPHDNALQQILDIDPEFLAFAGEKKIYCGGPANFFSLTALAKEKINYQQQLNNQAMIITETSDLLERLSKALTYAAKMQKALGSAQHAFDSFAKSVNGRVYPTVRRLIDLGVSKPKTQLPAELHINDNTSFIDDNEK